MAEGNKHFDEFGYPDERFESVVSDDLHCGICSCVLKDPVMCKNEHCFCRGCITKHLENYHTCPSCNQDLTVESLVVAPRIVRNLLSEQKIRCDYYERGCEEIVQLRNLVSHVAVCGKTPVVCANEKCSSEINKEDQFQHESEECRFREVKCRNCKEMNSTVQEIETNLGGLCEHVKRLNTSVHEQVGQLNISVNEMKTGLTAVENRFEKVENKLEEMENKFENRFVEMENKFGNRLEKTEIRSQQVENQLLNIENHAFRNGHSQNEAVQDEVESARSDQATALDPKCDLKDAKDPNVTAYIVAGGYGNDGKPLNSAEIFDKTTNSWIQLNPMNKSRAGASAVVYNGQILVTGGTSDDNTIVSSIEQFSRNPNPNLFVPPFWSYFPANLPKALTGHHTVLYKNRMLVIGGYDGEKKMYSDIIYEIQLHFPFTTKILAKLPSSIPIDGGVVLSNDNILIFRKSTVAMYNITQNEFKEVACLPYVFNEMAIVKMGENVIVAGSRTVTYGPPKREESTILSYNIETGQTTELPTTYYEYNNYRYCSECCNIVDGNSLFFMGGLYQTKYLQSSVNVFDVETSKLSNLPPMKEARRGFVAGIV